MPLGQQLLARIVSSPRNRGVTGPKPMALHTQLPITSWVMVTAPQELSMATEVSLLSGGAKPRSSLQELEGAVLPSFPCQMTQ